MKKFSLLLVGLVSVLLAATAQAAPFLMTSFRLHNADAAILKVMGYDVGSIVYFKELASITPDQLKTRQRYENISCHPFYFMKDGKIEEEGYNCQTFFCTGYRKGPKLCQDQAGKPYGGVVEINRRLNTMLIRDTRKNFSEFPEGDQTKHMQDKIAELNPVRCTPFYLMRFDVAVGEGYSCEEVGSYPYYSSKNYCADDWRDDAGLVCDKDYRPDEFDVRKEALKRTGGQSSSAFSSSSNGGVATSSEASSSSMPAFPDVMQGHYGYTAITSLAASGIVQGYADGTFRPFTTVNRAEFLKMLIGGLYSDQIIGEQRCFPDVTDQWFSAFVCAAKRLGWIAGYADGFFRPESTLKKSEALKIVISSLPAEIPAPEGVLPPGVATDAWYSIYVCKAVGLHILLEAAFQPGADVTRADAAVWMYRARKAIGE